MRSLIPVVGMLVLIGCGGQEGGPGVMRKSHASARILLKENTGCKSRTVPPTHVLLKGEEDTIVWTIKQQGNCLPNGTELVIKWVEIDPMNPTNKTVITDLAKVPTKCLEISTDKNGDKREISCELQDNVPVATFSYQVYLRKNGTDTVIEDPDVEIVMF